MRRALLVGLSVVGAGALLVYWHFDPLVEALFQYPPPEVVYPQATNDANGREQDADYLAAFTRYDRSYSAEAKRQADVLAARLKKDAATLTRAQFVLRVAEIAALADNGHTQISEDALMTGVARLPLRSYWFADGLYVVRAKASAANLIGSRIDTIDGKPIDALYAQVRKYVGGQENHRHVKALALLESPELLNAAGLVGDPQAVTLGGVRGDGTPFTARVAGETSDDGLQASQRTIYPASEHWEKLGWVSYFKRDITLPLYLQQGGKLFTIADLAAGGLYLDITDNRGSDDEPIGRFLLTALERIEASKPRYVVVDMRKNGGGDYTMTYDFAQRLPKMTERVYVLTSQHTFSAAITTTAFLKQAGGDRVTIVGTPVGDRLTFWAEGGRFVLPNSQIVVNYAAGKHDYAHFCWDVLGCFWLNYLYPVQVATLHPDVEMEMTFADYSALRDPALDIVLARETPPVARSS